MAPLAKVILLSGSCTQTALMNGSEVAVLVPPTVTCVPVSAKTDAAGTKSATSIKIEITIASFFMSLLYSFLNFLLFLLFPDYRVPSYLFFTRITSIVLVVTIDNPGTREPPSVYLTADEDPFSVFFSLQSYLGFDLLLKSKYLPKK